MYNRLKCKRVQRIHVQKYVAPTQAVCFYQKQSYLFNMSSLRVSISLVLIATLYILYMYNICTCCITIYNFVLCIHYDASKYKSSVYFS